MDTYDPLTYPSTAAIPTGSAGRSAGTACFELVRVTTVDGEHYRWRLRDDAGKVLARGGTLYPTPAAARRDIEAVRGCVNTPVVDLTEGETRPRLATSKFPPRQPGRDTVAADACPVCGGENEGNWSRCREHAVDLTGDGSG